MLNTAILSPRVSKESAGVLANLLDAELVFPYETLERDFTKYDYVFKYGFSAKIKAKKGVTFNKTAAVEKAMDKVLTFNALKGTGVTVDFTDSIMVAEGWLQDGHTVVAREFSNESNGKGITYCTTEKEFYSAPAKFWTKYSPALQELRIYLWRNKVLSIYVKETSKGFFVFKLQQGHEEHPQLIEMANKVYENIGLDFCGLDVLTEEGGHLRLLEVNSAPILFPFTAKRLVANIIKEVNK